MRRIGYGVRAEDEDQADFYVTALLLYPRSLANQLPFNESISSSEDRFMGALLRSKSVRMLWEPRARAMHDSEHNVALYEAREYEAHIYTNLFDALFVRKSVLWALGFEFVGFAVGARSFFRRPESALRYCWAWSRGNVRFFRDREQLRSLAATKLVGPPPTV